MAQTKQSFAKAMPQQDVMCELRNFIIGTTSNQSSNNLDLAKTALSLLRTLPAARDAVLEYFCTMFDIAVKNYILGLETEIATGKTPAVNALDEAMLAEIHSVLCGFIGANPEAWSPIISIWSLELLGELSSKYAGRAHIPTSDSLSESLQLWMGCRATRTLIDITTQCLTSLINSDTESCISALLDTSVKHSPHFDWVVAHVGSCFPNTVITRVLSCGLKDFSQHKSVEQGSKAPKLISVVGILSHLAGSHFGDIRRALLDLFHWSLQTYNVQDAELRAQKHAAVPFLLQLSSMSPTLLKAITTNISDTLDIELIPQLSGLTFEWSKYFGSTQSLQDLVVHLILGCEKGGIEIINLLLDIMLSPTLGSVQASEMASIKKSSFEILESLLQDMDMMVRHQNHHKKVNLLQSLSQDSAELLPMLLHSDTFRSKTAARIVILIGCFSSIIIIKTASFMLRNAQTDFHLGLLVRIISNELVLKFNEQYCAFPGCLGQVLGHTLLEITSDDLEGTSGAEGTDPLQLWRNLLTLLSWENSKEVPLLNSRMIFRALHTNLLTITKLFGSSKINPETADMIAEIIDDLEIPSKDGNFPFPSLKLCLDLTEATVNYFFASCKETDFFRRCKSQKLINKILYRLSNHSKAARVAALRELLERSIYHEESVLFGSKVDFRPKDQQHHFLLQKNQKQSTTTVLSQKHSSIFHAGVIGEGKRRPVAANPLSQDVITSNTEQLIRAIKACCSQTWNDGDGERPSSSVTLSLDSLTLVSLLLVKLISPDVMYNGLPWPDEDFAKVTIERDLHIRRLFTNVPLLWELMCLVGLYRPALCYCSVLLRAITATLLHQWNSTGQQSSSKENPMYQDQMATTVKLIDLMALGQLLPPPLSHMREVLPHLKAQEIVILLRECVWHYMKDHIPSPALFGCDQSGLHWRDPTIARPPSLYTDTLRVIMQKNIDKTGVQYAQLFLNRPESES